MANSAVRITSPIIGASLVRRTTDQEFPLGQRAFASDGGEYMYILAGEALPLYSFVGVDEAFTALLWDATEASGQHQPGCVDSTTAFASAEYGWVKVNGPVTAGLLLTGAAADVAIYTSATQGALTAGSTVGVKIQGIVAVAANTTGATTTVGFMMTNPHTV